MPHEIKLKTENITLDLCCNSLSKRYRLAISYVRLSCTIQRIVLTLSKEIKIFTHSNLGL